MRPEKFRELIYTHRWERSERDPFRAAVANTLLAAIAKQGLPVYKARLVMAMTFIKVIHDFRGFMGDLQGSMNVVCDDHVALYIITFLQEYARLSDVSVRVAAAQSLASNERASWSAKDFSPPSIDANYAIITGIPRVVGEYADFLAMTHVLQRFDFTSKCIMFITASSIMRYKKALVGSNGATITPAAYFESIDTTTIDLTRAP